MAVAHYQFEAIHPFTDGNGRTGRVIDLLFLVETGLLPVPVFYLSRYIIRRASRQLMEEKANWTLAKENLVDADLAKRQTASAYPKSLASLDVLEERSYGRHKLFVNEAFLRLLTTDDEPRRRLVDEAAQSGAVRDFQRL